MITIGGVATTAVGGTVGGALNPRVLTFARSLAPHLRRDCGPEPPCAGDAARWALAPQMEEPGAFRWIAKRHRAAGPDRRTSRPSRSIAGKITIKHGPAKSLGMDQGLQGAGSRHAQGCESRRQDKVNADQYAVTKIEKASNAA